MRWAVKLLICLGAASPSYADCPEGYAKLAKESLSGSAVSALRKGRTHNAFKDSVRIENWYLVTDAAGRKYVVEKHPDRFETFLFSWRGRLLEHGWRKAVLSERPATDPELQKQANAFATELLASRKEGQGVSRFLPSDFRHQFKGKLTPEMRVLLEKGVAVEIPPIEAHPKGATGTLRLGRDGVRFRLTSPQNTITVVDEQGRDVALHSARDGALLPDSIFTGSREGHSGDIDKSREILLQRKKRQAKNDKLKAALRFTNNALFYPWMVPIRKLLGSIADGHFEGRKIIRARPYKLFSDGASALLYVLFLETGTHPIMLFAEAALEEEFILFEDFVEQTEEKLGEAPEGLVLFIDGIDDKDQMAGGPKQMFEKRYRDDKNARYLKVDGVTDVVKAIQSIEKENKKIARLEIVGHGLTHKSPSPSIMPVASVAIGKEILVNNLEDFEKHLKRLDLPTEMISKVSTEVSDLPDMSGSFEKGAQVRMTSCYMGGEVCGDDFMADLAEKTISKKGGAVAMATIPIAFVKKLTPEEQAKKEQEIRRAIAYREQLQAETSLVDELQNKAAYYTYASFVIPVLAVGSVSAEIKKRFREEGPIKVKHFPPKAQP